MTIGISLLLVQQLLLVELLLIRLLLLQRGLLLSRLLLLKRSLLLEVLLLEVLLLESLLLWSRSEVLMGLMGMSMPSRDMTDYIDDFASNIDTLSGLMCISVVRK